MDHLRFAVCIVFPGTTTTDIVAAAVKHNVHILDKEHFDPSRDYSSYHKAYTLENGAQILPLFVFASESILADNAASLKEALLKLREYLG